jgi:hypothetical protein
VYTILQPTYIMDMFPLQMLSQKWDEHSKTSRSDSMVEAEYPMMWSPAIEFSFVAWDDLAAAAAVVLAERERHFCAAYEICGTVGMSYEAVCRV